MHAPAEQLIYATLRSGDPRRAVELLLDHYQDEIYFYCARTVGVEHAPTIYQRTLALAVRELPTIAAPISFRMWLYRLARQTILAADSRPADSLAGGVSRNDIVDTHEEISPLTPQQVALAERFSRLPVLMQEVLQLACWHGLPLTEVAQIVEHSPAEVRQLATDGLLQLAALAPSGSFGPS